MITKVYIESAPKHLFIMIGIPGSGKSTSSKKIRTIADEVFGSQSCDIASADNFFMVNGEYKFDPAKLGDAHKMCFINFLESVNCAKPVVIVDNTNLSIESMAPYAAYAHAYGYAVTLVYHCISAEESFKRNTHGVPVVACKRMHAQFQYLVGKTLRNTPVKAVFNFDSEGNDFDPFKL